MSKVTQKDSSVTIQTGKHDIYKSRSRVKDISKVTQSATEITLTVAFAGDFVGPREGDLDGTPVGLTWKYERLKSK